MCWWCFTNQAARTKSDTSSLLLVTLTLMNLPDLEKEIRQSLADFKFDQGEKILFRELSQQLRPDQLSFIRNKAFEISRPFMEKGGVDAIRVHNWLAKIVQAIQPVPKNVIPAANAYFSPGDECRQHIIHLINGAKQSINICVFTISDNRITKAILTAHKKGIVVAIISDNDKANDKGSDIHYLQEQGLNVILDRTSYHMHHKFALFDNAILLNGSFNWTRSASDFNEENILITSDPDLVTQFSRQFSQLLEDLK
jgi:phosphatidylserine/phosphatidylglycerophosphate/cardiolipin synthase-like enzyme